MGRVGAAGGRSFEGERWWLRGCNCALKGEKGGVAWVVRGAHLGAAPIHLSELPPGEYPVLTTGPHSENEPVTPGVPLSWACAFEDPAAAPVAPEEMGGVLSPQPKPGWARLPTSGPCRMGRGPGGGPSPLL